MDYHDLTPTQQELAREKGYCDFFATPETREWGSEYLDMARQAGDTFAITVGMAMIQNYNAIEAALKG